MNISLPDDMRAFVEAQIAQEGYASVSEYFRDLVSQAQRRKAKVELEAKMLEGLQGPLVSMDCKDWQSIEQEAVGRWL